MNQFCPYNSRDIRHKTPFGAVAAGETVRLCVLMPRSMQCSAVRLIVNKDGESALSRDFCWKCMNGDNEEWWELFYTFDSAGLFFYHFEFDTPFGGARIYLHSSGMGCFAGEGDEWQLTVYDSAFSTPDWIKGGIMYQIFPDRFFCSGEPKENVPEDRIIHANTAEAPCWQRSELNRDYYGGDLAGIISKLGYLASLGVTALYLNPIFEAHSNHRYNTADYTKIDSLLGTEQELKELCAQAKKYGIGVVLDGVFSHTGSDSIYFNRERRYGNAGAYNDTESEYREWYTFRSDGTYKCWWNIETLPETVEDNSGYLEFITGENGVLKKWLNSGISGWRLDVADELPDVFLDELRKCVKGASADNLIIGEVWEDATNKISGGGRRRYLLGDQLDGVMNYPFADAVLEFLHGGTAEELMETVVTVCENYPPDALNVLMNHIGTHDTARVLTRLADENAERLTRAEQAKLTVTDEEYNSAVRLLKAAAVMQYTLPGFPCVYYGDEAGMTGGSDPFNRGFYPWGHEDGRLIDFYTRLGKIRHRLECLKTGRFIPISAMLACVAYARESDCDGVFVAVNRNVHAIEYNLPSRYAGGSELLWGLECTGSVNIPALSAVIITQNPNN